MKWIKRMVDRRTTRQNERFKSNVFKRAVELLIENKIMSVNSIVSSLEEFGINLYPEDLELLMGLKKGLLSQEANKKVKL